MIKDTSLAGKCPGLCIRNTVYSRVMLNRPQLPIVTGPIIFPDEVTKYGIEEIEECGEIIHFKLIDCKVVHPAKWQEIDEVYFIVIDSPQLDLIRQKYGLPKREYDFHITIGIKPRVVSTLEGS